MSAIRDSILNNYLQMYQPSMTRYDSHKKSELRGTYNSIIKLNKESPWYLPVTSPETQLYAVTLKESARDLRSSIAELGGLEESSMLSKKSAYSSDESAVSASFIGDELPPEEAASFSMEVHSLASGQINTGNMLPDRDVNMYPGTYSFDVNINDMNYEFQFSISEGETNRGVQNRLVRLINNADIGMTASVLEEDGRSALQISSTGTGTPHGKNQFFSITDDHTSKRNGAVTYFGLNNMTTAPTDASFSINGEEHSASSNHFTVAKMYELTLNGTSSDGPAKIGLKTDTESVADNVSHLLGGYNDFLKSVSSYLESQSKSRKLVSELEGITNYYSDSLKGIGIEMSEDGSLSLDKDALADVANDPESLTAAFDTLRDFSNSLLRKSNQISIDPMNYVARTVVAYKNPGHNYASPYTTSEYSGMMFNFFC